jgi:competence protein ComEA
LDLVEAVRDDRALGTALALAALAVAGLAWFGWRALQPPAPPRAEDILPRVQLAPTTAPATTAAPLVVHVVGAVGAPGVRQLPAGSRVVDAVEAAGGPLDGADLSRLNLAAPLADGSQIRVPLVGEEVAGPLVSGPPPVTGGGAPGPVPLNTATAAELEALPGIGPATAAAIVAWREANGPFVAVDQLIEVRGIGPAKLEAVRDLVVVG